MKAGGPTIRRADELHNRNGPTTVMPKPGPVSAEPKPIREMKWPWHHHGIQQHNGRYHAAAVWQDLDM